MTTAGNISAYRIVTPFENGLTDGQVKVNTGNGVKPRYGNGDPSINGVWQPLQYQSPLGLSSFPTTSWPANVPTPTDADIYDFVNNTFLENAVLGQINFWRLQFTYNKSSTQSEIEVRIQNTLSGFTLTDFRVFVAGQLTGNFSLLMVTIADGASLPAPLGTGQGYTLSVRGDDNSFQQGGSNFIELDAVVRINTAYADEHY